MMKLKYLVTGTGRSGTVYMARLLTSVGIPCGHEAVFNWEGFDEAKRRLDGESPLDPSYASQTKWQDGKWVPLEKWMPPVEQIVADSSYLSAPWLHSELLEGVHVIHTVRNPIDVVQSFVNYIGYFHSEEPTNKYEDFIYKFIPELKIKMNKYERAALYWVNWNQMIEFAKPEFRNRVEDGPQSVLMHLNIMCEPFIKPFSDNTVNSYKKSVTEQFGLHHLNSRIIRDGLILKASSYGYKIGSEYLML